MRLTSLRLKGFSSSFPDVVDIPFSAIEPGLVALVGDNGAGKTTLLESVPAAIYRRLAARPTSPVKFAIARDSFIEIEFDIEGQSFRSRVTMDHETRNTAALLEVTQVDGGRQQLNNGQATTYDRAIKERFPSFELFINSAFAAQGRGDEFSRATPSERKDLFVEFLALKKLLSMAKAAGEAKALCAGLRDRLNAAIAALDGELQPQAFAALEERAGHLQVMGAQAELKGRELVDVIASLEARQALSADAPSAFAAAQLQAATFSRELIGRRQELQKAQSQRGADVAAHQREATDISARRDAELKSLDESIAANQQLQDQAENIRAAVSALQNIDVELGGLREIERRQQEGLNEAAAKLAAAKAAVSAFTRPQADLERAKADSLLLTTVPCHGQLGYADCKFLTNATAAAGRIDELEAKLLGLTGAVKDRDDYEEGVQALTRVVAATRGEITDRVRVRKDYQETASFATHLAESDAKIAGYRARTGEVDTEATRQLDAVRLRLTLRTEEHDVRVRDLVAVIARLEEQHRTALADVDAAAAGNNQAEQLAADLQRAYGERDHVQRTIGEVAGGREELARRRADLASKRQRLASLQERRARVDQELVEWGFLAKAFGKGGLPDLEIDAAGPTISALTNQLLLACYGPRFSLELVTQIEKTDGSGMKDEFSCRVLDNVKFGGWRDIAELSGGEKVIVQEALMCAISIFVNERSPMPMRTLFRDESGAALSHVNAVIYVSMLRKVRELGGYHHVLFISHDDRIKALADTQIHVGDGKARIVDAPFDASEAA